MGEWVRVRVRVSGCAWVGVCGWGCVGGWGCAVSRGHCFRHIFSGLRQLLANSKPCKLYYWYSSLPLTKYPLLPLPSTSFKPFRLKCDTPEPFHSEQADPRTNMQQAMAKKWVARNLDSLQA